MTPAREYDFFVSYASADNRDGWVDAFVAAFVEEHRRFSGGRTLTYFLDRDRIPHFSHWHAEIFAKGIARSRFFLAFLSPNYLASDVCRREWRAWVEQEIALHILAEGASPIYFVEVPGLYGKPKLTEHEMAAKVGELCAVPSVDRLAADLGAMAKEFRRRQRLDLVKPFRNEGLKAFQSADTQATLRKLAEHLDARVQEAKRADASANTVPPYNPRFSGRLDELVELRTLLTDNRAGVIAGIHGLGGIGKTELAYTYAHAFAGVYPGGRFEVKCEYQTSLQTAVNIALGSAPPFQPHITDDERKHPDHLFAAIKRCLKQRLDTLGSVLLVLDNVSHTDLLRPQETDLLTVLGPSLHLLATTRNVATLGVKALVLGELKPADALALMEKYRPFADGAEEAAAGQIVAKLGGFALAIELVAAKLAVTPSATYAIVADGLGLDDLDVLAEQTDVVLRRHNHEKRLAAVLGPTLASLTPMQRRAMDYAAFLPPDNVPLPWLKTLLTEDFSALATPTKWGDPWKELVRHLVKLGLLTPVQEESTSERQVKVHRLVQTLVRREMSGGEEGWRWQWRVERLMKDRVLAVGETTNWEAARWELAPLEAVAWAWDQGGHRDAVATLGRVAIALQEVAEFTRAEGLFRRALAVESRAADLDPAGEGIALNNLAELLHVTGRSAEAEPLYRRALAMAEAHPGSEHTSVAIRLNNLAGLLRETKRLKEAEPLYRRALAIWEKCHGPNHSEVARGLNNLAGLLRERNRPAKGEPLFRRALAIAETHFPADHPFIVTILSNLAVLLNATERHAEAEPLFRRVLTLREANYGPDHPEVALVLSNLALLLTETNRHAEAEPLYLRALDISLRHFDEGHRLTQLVRHNLRYSRRDLFLRRLPITILMLLLRPFRWLWSKLRGRPLPPPRDG